MHPARLANARAWRVPPEARRWRVSVLVVLLVVVPPGVTIWLAPHSSTLTHQADMVGLFVYPVVLASALHVYFHWRLTDHAGAGTLAVCLFAAAVQGLSRVALRMEHRDDAVFHAVPHVAVDVLFALVLLLVLVLLPRREHRVDPGGLGVSIGLAFCVLRFVAAQGPSPLVPEAATTGALPLLLLLLLGLHVAVAGAALRLPHLPPWFRARLAVAVVLLGVHHAMTHSTMDQPWHASIAITTDLLGAMLLVGTTIALLRDSTRRRRLEADQTERHRSRDQERLHEIVSTVAGIASANRLMHDPRELPGQRREQLQQMMGSEIARLERLIQERRQDPSAVDLDETVRPLVVAHRARGGEAHWSPTGLTVHGRQDDIAEVIHVLLDNAATHAPGASVRITAEELDDGIEIQVRDTGPGIPPELAQRAFLPGERGPDSRGQGIGLDVAARLMNDMGGSLRLLPTMAGTTFVLRIPKARRASVAPAHPSK